MRPQEVTPAHLASAVGFSEPQLWAFARSIERRFKPTRRKRVKKKIRIIDEPMPSTKPVLKKIHDWFQGNLQFHSAAFGGIAGRSCIGSARRHIGAKYIVTRDAQDAFPSVRSSMMREKLIQAGFTEETSALLTLLLTVRDRIPQGGNLSTDALNLYLLLLDQSVASVVGHRKMNYSRVCDDLVISCDRAEDVPFAAKVLDRQLARHKLKVNERKKEALGVQTPETGMRVHNFEVHGPRIGVRINADQHAHALALGEDYVRTAARVGAQDLFAVAKKRQRLLGWINHCRQTGNRPAKHLNRLREAGDRHVERRLKRAGLVAHVKKWWVVGKRINRPALLSALWRTG